MAEQVAFLGLGVMGFPMAGHLARAGHRVTVFNRTRAKAEAWVAQHGGMLAETPKAAVEGARLVFACVGNDDDLAEVTTGPQGAFATIQKGTIFVDHTTASAVIARTLDAEARGRGFGFIDAPVSGGQAGAEKGQLSIMCGGSTDDFARVEPVLAAYGKMVRLMGPAGHGQLTKMVNQIAIAGLVEALSEALNFARASGLDGKAVLDVISKGAAQSWQMENRGGTMLDGKFDFGFAVNWMRKDLGICLEEAKRIGVSLPATALVDQLYAEVQSMGGGRWDTSSLIARLTPRAKP